MHEQRWNEFVRLRQDFDRRIDAAYIVRVGWTSAIRRRSHHNPSTESLQYLVISGDLRVIGLIGDAKGLTLPEYRATSAAQWPGPIDSKTDDRWLPLLQRTTLRDFYATDNMSTAPSTQGLAIRAPKVGRRCPTTRGNSSMLDSPVSLS